MQKGKSNFRWVPTFISFHFLSFQLYLGNHPKLLTVTGSSVPLHSWVSVPEELKVLLVLVRVRGGGGAWVCREPQTGSRSPRLQHLTLLISVYSPVKEIKAPVLPTSGGEGSNLISKKLF